MATILAKFLEQQFSTSDIVKWLKHDTKSIQIPDDLKELDNLKKEFVPFFINYLRDQTFNLLQSGHSSNTTPAKTPLSTKFKKQFSKSKNENKTKSDYKSRNRIQLFESGGGRSAPRKSHGGGKFTPNENDNITPRSQRSIHFTPDSSQRSKGRHSFGDFITPEAERKKKSPHSGRKDDGFSPMTVQQHSGKRSSGKKGDRHNHSGLNVVGGPPVATPPQFTLESDDFPSLASGSSTSTPKPGKSLPEGTKLITSSRRITPTLLKSTKLSKRANLKDLSGSKRPDSPGAGSKSSMFASPSAGSGWNTPGSATNAFSSGQALTFDKTHNNANNSLEDERQMLRAIRSGDIQSPSDNCFLSPQPGCNVPVTTQAQVAASALIFSPVNIIRPAHCNISSPVNVRPPGIIPISSSPAIRQVTTTSLLQQSSPCSLTGSGFCPSTTPTKASVLLASIREKTTPVKTVTNITATMEESSTVTPTKPAVLERMQSQSDFIPADLKLVTHKSQLELLTELYIAFIDDNLVPNLTVELYFIIQLLTVRGPDIEASTDITQEPDEIEYLNTVHNAVYFAVTVLSKQTRVLQLLDKGTLRLLLENQRLAEFEASLKDKLSQLYEKCPAKGFPMGMSSPIGSVSFQAETDNRNNFPTDRSFHLFCKQRDMFYELLRVWQENHMTSGWSLVETHGNRIHGVVAERSELGNFVHFARLFQSQLISMCKADRSHLVEGEENNVTLLVQLKKLNPEKFKRLQERFITPASYRGPCPSPHFPGCQEFFRDFVLAARCPQFYQHLSDTLTAKITELNTMEFHVTENIEDTSDVEERERLSCCLVTVRLLAKFLGLLHFLPYQTTEHLSARVTNTCIAVRDKVSPTVDLLVFLKCAQRCGRVTLTIPWVIEYLSMMDVVTPQLEHFQAVLMYLLKIHRHVFIHFAGIWNHSLLLVISYLGWLFELPVFPEGLFFREFTDSEEIQPPPEGSLDTLGLVDQQILYTCCPYLGDLRLLLVEFAVGTSSRNNQNNIRKITPISTEGGTSTALSEKQLQHQLEENFFHNHPASLKRTVEFVADRVASNHIKKFRASILPPVLTKVYKDAGELATEVSSASPDTRHLKKSDNVILQKSLLLFSKLRKNDQQESVVYCCDKVREILPQLVPEDISDGVLAVCHKIAQRLAGEKIQVWMNTHITTAMLKREMTSEYEKRLKIILRANSKALEDGEGTNSKVALKLPGVIKTIKPVVEEDITNRIQATSGVAEQNRHNKDALSPSDVLLLLKDVSSDIMVEDKMEDISFTLLDVFTKLRELFSSRQDLLPNVTKCMGRMVADIACCLVCTKPAIWQNKIMDTTLELLQTYFKSEMLFDGILSSRNISNIPKSEDRKLSWQLYKDLITWLLHLNFVSHESICSSAVTCLQARWEDNILQELIPMLCSIIKEYHLNKEVTSEDFFPLIDTMFQLEEGKGQGDGNIHQTVKDTMTSIHNHHSQIDKTHELTSIKASSTSEVGNVDSKIESCSSEVKKKEEIKLCDFVGSRISSIQQNCDEPICDRLSCEESNTAYDNYAQLINSANQNQVLEQKCNYKLDECVDLTLKTNQICGLSKNSKGKNENCIEQKENEQNKINMDLNRLETLNQLTSKCKISKDDV